MEPTILLLKNEILRCENEIKYNNKFLELEKEFYPERYKNSMIRINSFTHKKESYQRAMEILENSQTREDEK